MKHVTYSPPQWCAKCHVPAVIPSAGADSPTCSNGVTPPSKSKSHSKYPGVSSASSSSSSSPSSVNYSETNSTDSTKSQPHSATSNQETRWDTHLCVNV